MSLPSKATVESWFDYHQPTEKQLKKIEKIRATGKQMGNILLTAAKDSDNDSSPAPDIPRIVDNCKLVFVSQVPPSPELNLALGRIEDLKMEFYDFEVAILYLRAACMFANSAIILDGGDTE